MKLLIVGNRGMLGTDLMRTFAPEARLWGMDLAELDITSAPQCMARAEEIRPDVIINAAALTAVDYCETHEAEAFLANAQGPANLAAAAASVGARLVHYSTDYVFDGRKAGPYLEEDETRPASVYGRSKLRGEELVRDSGPNHLILRTAWLYGCNGKNFIRTILTAARAGESLRVVDDQRGSPTFSLDLAACTLRLVAAGSRGTYHATNGGSCTWFELACRAVEWAAIPGVRITPVPTSEYPRPAPRPANSVLENAHLARDGFPPLRPWEEAAREYIATCEKT